MLSKLVDLVAKSVGDVTRSRLIGEHLGQLVHRAKHVAHLLLNRLGVLLLERTWTASSQFTNNHDTETYLGPPRRLWFRLCLSIDMAVNRITQKYWSNPCEILWNGSTYSRDNRLQFKCQNVQLKCQSRLFYYSFQNCRTESRQKLLENKSIVPWRTMHTMQLIQLPKYF